MARGKDFVVALRSDWKIWLAGGACSFGAYGLVLIAVRYVPVGYMATLRESSVVLGAPRWMVVIENALDGREPCLQRLCSVA